MIKSIIQRPLLVYLLAIMISLAGLYSAFTLPIKLQPNVNAPFLLVSAHVDKDTDLDDMEKELTIPLETLALSKDYVKDVNSTTTTNNVSMEIMLKDTASQQQVDKLREELNQELNSAPLELDYQDVRQFSSSDNVIMVIAVSSDHPDQARIREQLKNVVVPALREVPGVSKIEHTLDIYEEEYRFELKPDRVQSLQQASRVIEEIRSGFASPLLGSLTYNGEEYRVRSDSAISGLEELQQYRLSTGERLMDLTELEVDMAANHNYYMMSGEPYYEIDVFASSNASEVKISEQVRAKLQELHNENPEDWNYLYAWDASSFIGMAVNELVINILIGALVAAAVLFVVFRSVRTMLVVGLSMPICILTTLVSMSLFGYSINIITLMGIGLGTGMIVDACIVVIENIIRKLQEGKERLEAVVEGTKEVFAPVLASIMTTVAVFVPIAFTGGMIGVFLKQLALTVTVSLLMSLVVALTLIPILSHKLIRFKEAGAEKQGRIMSIYEKFLTYVLRRKWRTLFAFVLVFLVSMYFLVALVPKSFMPNITDRSLFIDLEVDDHIDYDTNLMLMDATAEKLLPIDGVKEVLYWGSDSNASTAMFIVLFEDREDMQQSDEAMKDEIKQVIDANIPYSFMSMGEGQADTSGQMTISLAASSMGDLVEQVPAVQDELELIQGVTGTQASLTEGSKEWVIDFSREQLSHYGITREEVEQYISLVLNGVQDIDIELDGQDATASIQFPAVYRQSSDALYQMPIRSDLSLTIDDVAELKQVDSEAARVRKDGEYELELNIYFDPEQRDAVIQRVTRFVENYSGTLRPALAGTQQEQAEGFQTLLVAVAVSFATVFLILTVQFNRMRLPFLIMLSLPFAMIGVALGFFITGRVFDIMAMIGIVMLVGIVVNNAIVLIDFINKHRADYSDVTAAIVEGAKLRLRPIMTTTLTTVGGLIPMFIGGSETSDFQTPIATAVIFGLLFSTFVSLVLVPVLYIMFEGRGDLKKDRKNSLWRKFRLPFAKSKKESPATV